MITSKDERTLRFTGLKKDTKPTDSYISNGSIFIEMDTSTIYFWDKENKK